MSRSRVQCKHAEIFKSYSIAFIGHLNAHADWHILLPSNGKVFKGLVQYMHVMSCYGITPKESEWQCSVTGTHLEDYNSIWFILMCPR